MTFVAETTGRLVVPGLLGAAAELVMGR